jgi:hypothetical protein
VLVFAALTAAVIAYAHAQPPNHTSDTGAGLAIVWGIAGLVCGTACVLACRAALFATAVQTRWLRTALRAGTVVTVAMVAIAAATAIYAVALAADASPLAGESNGPFQVLSVTTSLIIQVAVMVGAAVLAVTTTLRGWRVESQVD